jgi:hypothetical protein
MHVVNLSLVSYISHVVNLLTARSPGFAPGSFHVGFVVGKVALGQVFLPVL